MFNSTPEDLRGFLVSNLRPVGRKVFIAQTNQKRFAVILGRKGLIYLELTNL